LALLLAGAALLLNVAEAQAQAPPPADGGRVSYPAEFYAPFRPSNAKEMVDRTPGFTLEKGDDVRGFGGAAGNVLIDGQRPASKSVPLDQVLQRISAGSVERIEIIRGGAPGIDMQGQSVIANVVRKNSASLTGGGQVLSKHYENGFVGVVGRGDLSWRSGPTSAEAQTTVRHDLATDSGDGDLTRRRADGSLFESGRLKSRILTHLLQLNGAAEHSGAVGKVRLSTAFQYEDTDRADAVGVRPALGAGHLETVDIDEVEKDAEFGLDFERPIGGALVFRAVALQRLSGEDLSARSRGRSGGQTSEEDSNEGESILRGLVRWDRSPGSSLEVGAEGAFNFLEASSALAVNGTPVALPSANVRIEERRGEVFSTASVRLSESLSLEAGLRAEASTLRQSGGVTQETSFVFVKPRVAAAWSHGPWQARVRLERAVGQLDFDDFAASSELDLDSVNAGNVDLVPQREWLGEIALERRFWGTGAVVLTLAHAEIEKVVDLVPIQNQFDAPGNIGKGRRDELRLSLSLPLDRFRLTGTQLRFNGAWRTSSVADPVTGERRRISAQRPFEGDLFVSKSLPSLRSALSVEATLGFRETSYRINEVRTVDEAPLWKLIWDWTPRPDILVRFQAENFTDRLRYRDRTTFVGSRASGLVNVQERREARLSRHWTMRVRKTF
jgi:hypothetical protein